MVQIIDAPQSGLDMFLQTVIPQLQSGLQGVFQAHQQRAQQKAQGASLADFLGLPPEQSKAFAGIHPEIQKEIVKRHTAQKGEGEETKRIAQTSFNRMEELLKEGKLGLGSKLKGTVLGGKTAEDVGEFESLSGALEAMLVDRVNRGTLSNARFNYITKTLIPRPNDRQATIRGKLKALARELELSSSGSEPSKSEGKVTVRLPDGRSTQVERSQVNEIRKRSKQHFGKDIEVQNE